MLLLSLLVTVLISANIGTIEGSEPFGSNCSTSTLCSPFGHWKPCRGMCNFENDSCTCVSHPNECEWNGDCCSGKCEDYKCTKSQVGDLCTKDTCDNGSYCDTANGERFSQSYKGQNTWGVCKGSKSFGSNCTTSTLCSPMGHWKPCRGMCNVENDSCTCVTYPNECEWDEDCCSGNCEDYKCTKSQVGDLCTKDTCVSGSHCDTGYDIWFAPSIKNQNIWGVCEGDQVPFGGPCIPCITECQPFGNWNVPKGVCSVEGNCSCRVTKEECEMHEDCCSRKCYSNRCFVEVIGDPCNRNTNESCMLGACDTTAYDTAIPSKPVVGNTWGLCKEESAYRIDCGVFPKRFQQQWPAGIGSCESVVEDEDSFGGCLVMTQCNGDADCCSGICSEGKCLAGFEGHLCSKKLNSCGEHLGCTGTIDRYTKEYGACQECAPFASKCTNETYCCPFGNWPGGLGSCHNGVCDCLVYAQCSLDKECCSGNCLNGYCAAGGQLDICGTHSGQTCNSNFTCNIPSADPNIRKMSTTLYGTCKNMTWGIPKVKPVSKDMKIQFRIRDGEHAMEGSWPWMAHLLWHNIYCDGVLISPRYVLTAASCFLEPKLILDISQLQVKLGVNNPMKERGLRVKATKFIPHPSFNTRNGQFHDIALIQLDQDVPVTNNINYIGLAESNFEPGHNCMHTSYGLSGKGTVDETINNELRQAKFTIYNSSESYTDNNGKIRQCTTRFSQICAKNLPDARGACEEDIGGPLVCQAGTAQWDLQGILGFGQGCTPNLPIEFTNVAFFKDWIVQTMRRTN